MPFSKCPICTFPHRLRTNPGPRSESMIFYSIKILECVSTVVFNQLQTVNTSWKIVLKLGLYITEWSQIYRSFCSLCYLLIYINFSEMFVWFVFVRSGVLFVTRNLAPAGNTRSRSMYIANFSIFLGCQWLGVELSMVNTMILSPEGPHVGNMTAFSSSTEEETKDIHANLVPTWYFSRSVADTRILRYVIELSLRSLFQNRRRSWYIRTYGPSAKSSAVGM